MFDRQGIAGINHSEIICTAGRVAGSSLHSSRTGRSLVLVGRSSVLIAAAALIVALGACKADVVGNDLHSGTVVSVLILILAGLQRAFNGNQTAFLEILGDKLGLLTPCDDVDKIGLTLFTLAGEVAVTCNAEADHIDTALGGAELRVGHKAAHDGNNIQHNTDSFS